MKKIVSLSSICFFILFFHGDINANDLRYQYTHFTIHNRSHDFLMLTFPHVMGTWKKAVPNNMPIWVDPKSEYRNTLISINNNDGYENFAEINVADKDNPKDNYLILSEKTSEHEKSVSQYIADGLGNIFVHSLNNHCIGNTHAGFANCDLLVQ